MKQIKPIFYLLLLSSALHTIPPQNLLDDIDTNPLGVILRLNTYAKNNTSRDVDISLAECRHLLYHATTAIHNPNLTEDMCTAIKYVVPKLLEVDQFSAEMCATLAYNIIALQHGHIVHGDAIYAPPQERDLQADLLGALARTQQKCNLNIAIDGTPLIEYADSRTQRIMINLGAYHEGLMSLVATLLCCRPRRRHQTCTLVNRQVLLNDVLTTKSQSSLEKLEE